MVAAIEPDPSGSDVSLLALETGGEVGRGRLLDLLAAAELTPSWLATRRDTATGPALHLLAVDGFLPAHEPRLARALNAAREHVLRSAWLGSYARPLPAGG